MRMNIIRSASMLFAKNGFCGVTIDDICSEANTYKNTIFKHFDCIESLYLEILRIGQLKFFDHGEFNDINKLDVSAKSKIDQFIEHLVFHIYEKDNWPTKVFARELLIPSNLIRNLTEPLIIPKLNSGLDAIENYTGLKKDDPLLLATLFSCFSPGLRLIALTNDDSYEPTRSLLLLPKKELCSYLKTYIFGGLDAIKSIALH